MSFQQIIQRIRRGDIQSIYTVFGQEVYLQEVFERNLRQQFDEDSLEVTAVDLDEMPFERVLQEADSFSFFSPKRLVLVHGVTFTSAAGASQLTKQEAKAWEEYLKNPNTETIVVLYIHQDRVDRRRKMTKLLQNQTVWVDVSVMDERAVRQQVNNYLQEVGLVLAPDALDELLNRTGFQLTSTMNELVKLQQAGGPVDLKMVQTLVPRTLESDVFALTNAIAAGQISKATQIYQDLLLLDHTPIQLHALIVSQFRIMFQSKILHQSGLLEQDIASHLKVHPYRVKLALQSGREVSLERLVGFYDELIETDFKMKQGIGFQEAHFDLLLTKIHSL